MANTSDKIIPLLQKELQQKGQLVLHIKVVPKSSKTEIVGMLGSEIKIRLAAVAAKNKANKELITFLALTFQVPAKNITLKSGLTSPHKTLLVKAE